MRQIILLLLLFCSSALLWAQESLMLGNGKRNSVSMEQVGNTERPGFCLHFSRYKMRAYKGCQIASVSLSADVSAEGHEGRVFVASDMEGSHVLAEQVFVAQNKWNDIVFDAPYVVDGSDVYIGYELEGAKFLICSGRLVQGDEFINVRGRGWKAYDDENAPALYATVVGDNLPHQDILLGQVMHGGFAAPGSVLPLSMELVNLGLDPVRSVELTSHFGNVQSKVCVDGLDIASRSKQTVAVEGIMAPGVGDYTAWVEVTAVNGSADAAPVDNSSGTWQLLCRDDFQKRKLLLEVFSTERCTNCPSVHRSIDYLFADNNDVIELGHHAGFYDDKLSIAESKDYEWFYTADRGTYAPAAMFDRTMDRDNYPQVFSDGVAVFDAAKQDNLKSIYGMASAIPAFVSLDMERSYDAATRQLQVSVSGHELLSMAGATDLRLNVFVVEDSVASDTQAGAMGTFYHRHVARQSLTGSWGVSVDVNKGFLMSFSADIPEEWNDRHLSVVAFVSNYDSKDKTNCRVLNSEAVSLTDEADAIMVLPVRMAQDDSCFNLQGQRVRAGARGLVVAGGRKVLLAE